MTFITLLRWNFEICKIHSQNMFQIFANIFQYLPLNVSVYIILRDVNIMKYYSTYLLIFKLKFSTEI